VKAIGVLITLADHDPSYVAYLREVFQLPQPKTEEREPAQRDPRGPYFSR